MTATTEMTVSAGSPPSVTATGPSSVPPLPLDQRPSANLPAWPVVAMVAGFPLWWMLGLMPFVPSIFGFIMLAYLVTAHGVRVYPGVLALAAFVAWVLVCAVSVASPLKLLSYYVRFAIIAAALVSLVYVTNARFQLTDRRILLALSSLWALVIVGGYLGMIVPDFRFTTPVAALIPQNIADNALVRALLHPKMAEVQWPPGSPKPFLRPSAPFPYTNSWGLAMALLSPMMIALTTKLRSFPARLLVYAGLVASLAPAVATSNRGMFLVLGVMLVYVVVRLTFQQNLKALAIAAAAGIVGAAIFVWSGAWASIAERQTYSDTTSGRASVYAMTFRETLKSPIVGYGGPRTTDEISIALGTQGALWQYLFAYGFIGVFLFALFLVGALLRTARVRGSHDVWIHAVLLGACVAFFFYGFDFPQLLTLILAIAILLRRPFDRFASPPSAERG